MRGPGQPASADVRRLVSSALTVSLSATAEVVPHLRDRQVLTERSAMSPHRTIPH